MSNTNNNLQTQTSNALHNAIIEAGDKDRPPITIPVAKGSLETTTEGYIENYKNVSQDIKNQLDAEVEAVQIILTGIDNDIYSTVDACLNACKMWKEIERLKQGESINVQDLETNLYWEFGKFTFRDGETLESYYLRFYKMVNVLVRNQCDVTNHQVNVQFLLQLQPKWQRFVTLVKQSQELKIVSYHKLYNILKKHQNKVNEIRAERLARTANLLALRAVNVARARENANDATYHKEKILLYKQEEAGFQLNAKQADWRDDTDDEPEDHELEAHYLYMAQIQEVTPDAADNSGPIFDAEPLQKLVEIILFIIDSRCSKHIVGNKRILNCYYCWFKLQLLVGVTAAAQD
ncbi:hypothetical protein Tco_0576315 [Tanacetum coccineum]